ncbi:hypothetical protein HAX54_044909 [Datura stramonium]|uniref:Uncharacterized protein n=1 Tax=Datura stramonium TaxID=4076 RepID=A0ABS8SR53_DATST|nr:hypothetical protein [Datura stramonium]
MDPPNCYQVPPTRSSTQLGPASSLTYRHAGTGAVVLGQPQHLLPSNKPIKKPIDIVSEIFGNEYYSPPMILPGKFWAEFGYVPPTVPPGHCTSQKAENEEPQILISVVIC